MANPLPKAPSEPAATAVPAEPKTTEQMLAEALSTITALMGQQTQFNEYLAKNAPRRRKSMSEYLKENPRKRFLHPVWTNNKEANPKGLSIKTIEKVDTLASGVYCDGLITVVRVGHGTEARIQVFYNNKHDAQRMAWYIRFPTMTSWINAVADEMAAKGIPPVQDVSASPVVLEFPEGL